MPVAEPRAAAPPAPSTAAAPAATRGAASPPVTPEMMKKASQQGHLRGGAFLGKFCRSKSKTPENKIVLIYSELWGFISHLKSLHVHEKIDVYTESFQSFQNQYEQE